MFALPGASYELGQKLSRRAAERIASNGSMLLLPGLITVSGIWAVAIGVARVIFSCELRRLPSKLERGEAGEPASATSA